MNRYIFFLLSVFTLLLISQVKAEEPNLKNIRRQLVRAIEKSKTTDSLYKSLEVVKDRSGLIDGYMAALQSLKAKHSWNPYFKIKYLKDAEKTFKKAVAADPHNIEIRFMRFSVEHNVPGFLGFNKELAIDSEEIISQIDKRNYGTADKPLTIEIIRFLLDSKRCTPVQNDNLNQHLAALK
ncbi:hypothetical protein [Mucilaginibacter sp. SP1R1]|uniref:hypothetical protein n=1 Tax=Mucilaginibacter sp. SP1R1 TaxID=2723091 RepID=UPI001609A950|nr:hypothetical protein [Mucilaginibacter sp. SP1R1]MBB6150739.1 hypothetical protein [Mucilaginibacter sp. SP1R1]